MIEIIRIRISGIRFDKSLGIGTLHVHREELVSRRCNDAYSYRGARSSFFLGSWTTATWRMRRGVIVNYRLFRLTRNSCHEIQLPPFPSLRVLLLPSSPVSSKRLQVIVTTTVEGRGKRTVTKKSRDSTLNTRHDFMYACIRVLVCSYVRRSCDSSSSKRTHSSSW